jgi:hypothetical protein
VLEYDTTNRGSCQAFLQIFSKISLFARRRELNPP